MATNPQLIAQIDHLLDASRRAGNDAATGVNRVLSLAKARIEKQDELIMDVLTVRDHYAMAALQGMCSRPGDNEDRYVLAECFRIADLMLELRRG